MDTNGQYYHRSCYEELTRPAQPTPATNAWSEWQSAAALPSVSAAPARRSKASLSWLIGVGIAIPVLAILAMAILAFLPTGSSRNAGNMPPGTAGGTASPAQGEPSGDYLARRASFQTHLTRVGPSPQAADNDPPPPGVREVSYRSGNLDLKALLWVSDVPSSARRSALVYLHGGFALGGGDILDCQPFVASGFVVMTPSYRGENGNAGNFEMYLGEVDDAVAAIQWLRGQPEVDPERIYVFGHSAGGVLSALLSLRKDVPIRYSGSAGGLYGPDVFDLMTDMVPFNLADPAERQIRVLPGNTASMRRKHYAYIGQADSPVKPGVRMAQRNLAETRGLLEITFVPGDHFKSLPTAMREFLEVVRKNP